jgi:hypothetical protein
MYLSDLLQCYPPSTPMTLKCSSQKFPNHNCARFSHPLHMWYIHCSSYTPWCIHSHSIRWKYSETHNNYIIFCPHVTFSFLYPNFVSIWFNVFLSIINKYSSLRIKKFHVNSENLFPPAVVKKDHITGKRGKVIPVTGRGSHRVVRRR